MFIDAGELTNGGGGDPCRGFGTGDDAGHRHWCRDNPRDQREPGGDDAGRRGKPGNHAVGSRDPIRRGCV